MFTIDELVAQIEASEHDEDLGMVDVSKLQDMSDIFEEEEEAALAALRYGKGVK